MGLPLVAVHKFPTVKVTLPDDTPALGVVVYRTEDILHAPGVSLKTHLLQLQSQIATMQNNLSALNTLVMDMQQFLAEQLGYQFGNHEAADAWNTLYDLEEKVPSNSQP